MSHSPSPWLSPSPKITAAHLCKMLPPNGKATVFVDTFRDSDFEKVNLTQHQMKLNCPEAVQFPFDVANASLEIGLKTGRRRTRSRIRAETSIARAMLRNPSISVVMSSWTVRAEYTIRWLKQNYGNSSTKARFTVLTSGKWPF